MQISVTDGVRPAIYFVIGCMLVEIIYVRVSLVAMNWVMRHKSLFRWLEWLSVVIILALAASSFVAATDEAVKKNVLLSGGIHRFWLGVIMSAVNPVQIPFWFGWSTVLFTKGVLLHRNDHYNIYIAGIGLGTFIGNLVFILGGRFVVDVLNTNQKILHFVIGLIFLVTAIILTIKIFRKKDI
ncbi:MAG: LysE family transporter [Chitinophagaceae bacterium]|nr:LysE family transporter [Chitinophagaceae bacterium]